MYAVHGTQRHNVVMDSPEARAKSAELHKKLLEEERLKNPSAEGEEDDDEEEGEVDENEDLSSGEEGIVVCQQHIFACRSIVCVPFHSSVSYIAANPLHLSFTQKDEDEEEICIEPEDEMVDQFLLASCASISSANEQIVYIEKVKVENPTIVKGKVVYTV